MDTAQEENPTPRRNILSEVNEVGTLKDTSPDELIIIQRGPRCKPEMWSPFEFNRNGFSSKDKTPDKVAHRRPEISARLKRRLTLSPTKDDALNDDKEFSSLK